MRHALCLSGEGRIQCTVQSLGTSKEGHLDDVAYVVRTFGLGHIRQHIHTRGKSQEKVRKTPGHVYLDGRLLHNTASPCEYESYGCTRCAVHLQLIEDDNSEIMSYVMSPLGRSAWLASCRESRKPVTTVSC